MEIEKKTLVVFLDWRDKFSRLTDAQFGELMRMCFTYAIDGSVEESGDDLVQLSFDVIQPAIEENIAKWHEKKKKRQESGRLGGLAKASNAKQDLANLPVTVTDTVTVTVNNNKDAQKCITAQEVIEQSELTPKSKAALIEWVKYKKERRESYKETGLKSLISKMVNLEKSMGADGVVESINNSMANGYKGIFPAKSREKANAGNKFQNFEGRQMSDDYYDDLEKKLLQRRG